ncbi:MAG: hypothetical protein ACUVS5_11870 [Anaerolineae bacterium]
MGNPLTDELVYRVAKALHNEASVLGSVGMWHVAYVMVCRLASGEGHWSTWDGVLREFYGVRGPWEPGRLARSIAAVTVAVGAHPDPAVLRFLAARDVVPSLPVELPPEPMYYVYSRQDVEKLSRERGAPLSPADVVVARIDKDVVVTTPDDPEIAGAVYQLHLFRGAPWGSIPAGGGR